MPETSTKPKVLFVFSAEVIADTLAMIFNQQGFEARAAHSGERAVELAPEFKPDVLVSDVIMYDLNGVDAAIRICRILPSVRVLLFSGWSGSMELVEAARAKGYDFPLFASPVHPQDLISKLWAMTGIPEPPTAAAERKTEMKPTSFWRVCKAVAHLFRIG